ncbi:hypothetical protein L2E82_34703 [Cichorium intybus]|uniref:Uncharacterized protein n=1 Tax=Cichorium intybus TaxID=13427 RepID=A0ACB9BMU3_CICIN|nr:hypothetical protein L2E82_34703 [Cichorium intybus]
MGLFLSKLILGCFYVSLDVKVGFVDGLLCFHCWVSGRVLAHHSGFSLDGIGGSRLGPDWNPDSCSCGKVDNGIAVSSQ